MGSVTIDKNANWSFRLAEPEDATQISNLIGSTWSHFYAYSVTESDLEEYLNGPLSVKTIESEINDKKTNKFIIANLSLESSSSSTAPTPQTSSMANSERSTPPSQSGILGVVQLVMGTSEPCLSISDPNQTIEIRRLYIDRSLQGSGLAQQLISQAEISSKEEGYKSAWLGVWEDNSRGKRFYEKSGFEVKGEHSFMVGESKRRDYIMEKAL